MLFYGRYNFPVYDCFHGYQYHLVHKNATSFPLLNQIDMYDQISRVSGFLNLLFSMVSPEETYDTAKRIDLPSAENS